MSRELFTNLTLATMERGAHPYGLVDDGAVAVEDGRIAWRGRRTRCPTTTPPGRGAIWAAASSRRR